MKGAGPFLLAVFAVRLALGMLIQAPGAAGPVLVPEFGLDWTQFGTLVGLFWLPGLVLVFPLGLAARRIGDRAVVLAGLGCLGGRRAGLRHAGRGIPPGHARLTVREVRLMCLAGACWACVNGTYMVPVTFAPALLLVAVALFILFRREVAR